MPINVHSHVYPFPSYLYHLREKLAPWLRPELLAAAGVPLAFNPWGYNAFALPEAVFVRAVALLALLLAVVRAGSSRRPLLALMRDVLTTPLVRPALLFGTLLLAASLASINPRVSIVGSFERQHGLLTVTAYLVLFVSTAATLHSHAQIERLWQALVWASAPIVVYGLAQAAGIGRAGWVTDSVSPVMSTLGRSNFVGAYLLLVLPLTAGRLLLARDGRLLSLLLGAQLACLAATQARGAWLAALAGGGIAVLLWVADDQKRQQFVRIGGVTVLLLALLLTLVVALAGMPAGVAELPGVERMSALADIQAGSSAARLTIWRRTLTLTAERPWLGYGPETMWQVFIREFPPQLVYYQGRDVIVDRAHLLWLDLMMAGGIATVGGFVLVLVSAGRLIVRGLRTAPDRWSRGAWRAGAVAIVGHLVGVQVGFDVVATATVFWLILGMLAALVRLQHTEVPASPSESAESNLLLYVPAALIVLTLIWLLCVRPIRADISYQQARLAETPAERVAAAGLAVDRWPIEPQYRLGLATATQQAGNTDAADSQLRATLRLTPHDPDIYATWGQILRQRGAYQEAEIRIRKAITMAPTVARYHMLLGVILVEQGRPAAGAAALERAVGLDSTDYVAYRHLADVYATLDRAEDAALAAEAAEYWYRRTQD